MEENVYPLEVDVLTAETDFKNGAILLDVREPMELGICKIEGSRDIPMGQIPGRLEELPKKGRLLVLCHHGSRSAQVTSFLRANGFHNAVNVAGGIDAWAFAVEPTLVRY
jgi:rhodanese-related sulfurtransferase